MADTDDVEFFLHSSSDGSRELLLPSEGDADTPENIDLEQSILNVFKALRSNDDIEASGAQLQTALAHFLKNVDPENLDTKDRTADELANYIQQSSVYKEQRAVVEEIIREYTYSVGIETFKLFSLAVLLGFAIYIARLFGQLTADGAEDIRKLFGHDEMPPKGSKLDFMLTELFPKMSIAVTVLIYELFGYTTGKSEGKKLWAFLKNCPTYPDWKNVGLRLLAYLPAFGFLWVSKKQGNDLDYTVPLNLFIYALTAPGIVKIREEKYSETAKKSISITFSAPAYFGMAASLYPDNVPLNVTLVIITGTAAAFAFGLFGSNGIIESWKELNEDIEHTKQVYTLDKLQSVGYTILYTSKWVGSSALTSISALSQAALAYGVLTEWKQLKGSNLAEDYQWLVGGLMILAFINGFQTNLYPVAHILGNLPKYTKRFGNNCSRLLSKCGLWSAYPETPLERIRKRHTRSEAGSPALTGRTPTKTDPALDDSSTLRSNLKAKRNLFGPSGS